MAAVERRKIWRNGEGEARKKGVGVRSGLLSLAVDVSRSCEWFACLFVRIGDRERRLLVILLEWMRFRDEKRKLCDNLKSYM